MELVDLQVSINFNIKMVIQNVMKQNTAEVISISKGIVRTAYNKLLDNIRSATANRQADLTELMLYDIDQFGYADTTSTMTAAQSNKCSYRGTASGSFFTTGEKRSRKPQLAFAMKKRLTLATGGRVNSDNKIVQFGAYSDQDFRRCFEYIIKSGQFVDVATGEDDKGEYDIERFVVDTDEVNRAIRGNESWNNLSNKSQKKVRKGDNKKTKRITVSHPTKSTPKTHKVNGETEPVNIPEAKKYWEDMLAYVNYNLEDVCGVSTTFKLNGKDFSRKEATL